MNLIDLKVQKKHVFENGTSMEFKPGVHNMETHKGPGILEALANVWLDEGFAVASRPGEQELAEEDLEDEPEARFAFSDPED